MTVDDKPSADDPEVATHDGLEDVSLSTPFLLPGALPPHRIIEQTPQPDGSISIKASTTTPHTNGYKDVKIDHYHVPVSKVDEVDLSPGAPPPSDDYLSRVEYTVLSPGSELEVHDDDSSTVYTSNVTRRGEDDASVTRLKRRKKKPTHRTTLMVAATVVFLVVILAVSFTRDSDAAPEAGPASPGYGGPPTMPPATPPGKAKTHHHHHHHHKNDESFDEDTHSHYKNESSHESANDGDGQGNSTFASPPVDENEGHAVFAESHI